jgi:superfamily I DNA/RNA helicase
LTKITKIIGLPGTGKTTKLSEILEDMFENQGVETDEVIFSSFSRSTSKAIFDKMSNLGYERDILPYFRTLHSLAARVLDLKQKESFVTENDYKLFCVEHGISLGQIKPKTIDEIEQYGVVGKEYVLDVGNILFGWWQYLKKKHVHPKEVIKAIKERNELSVLEQQTLEIIPTELILDWYYQWEGYKRSLGKYEYDDMMQEIVMDTIPFMSDIKYIVADEAQDLNLLQFEMLKLWIPQCEEAYFAYDKNQAIYFFNCADPNLVDRLDGENVRLLC